MTPSATPHIACTLTGGNFKARMAWINALTRECLPSHERHDLTLDLRYAPGARDRVGEMVRKERECCPFLNFDLRDDKDEVRLTITAPEEAREAAAMLFDQFISTGGDCRATDCCP